MTKLAAEDLPDAYGSLRVRVLPPPELVERIERERASWIEMPDKTDALRGRIISADRLDGGQLRITVSAGSDQGVAKTSKIFVVNGAGKPIGACTIERVDKRSTRCTTTLSYDDVSANPNVSIKPE